MKITTIANLSLNGKVLLAENPDHQPPKAGEEFFVQKVVQAGNIIIGRKTFEVICKLAGGEANIPFIFPNVEIVILSSNTEISKTHVVINDPEAALKYLTEKGYEEIVIGGGTAVYNAFLEKHLITDLYFNFVPVLTGDGGVLVGNAAIFDQLHLVESKTLEGGVVQIYARLKQ